MKFGQRISLLLFFSLLGLAQAEEPKAADGDAPLPEGWPAATKPGVTEIKNYPPYRSAVARAKGAAMGTDNVLFFSLFRHISKKEIAMTAPVVNTYDPGMIDNPKQTGEISMEFLYRTPTQGELGPGVGAVNVEDHPAATYICRGVQGEMSPDRLRSELATLKTWLAAHRQEWQEAGEPRRLGYHGPMTPMTRRLWELQIPIKSAIKRPD